MNFSSNISKRITKAFERLLEKTGLKKSSSYNQAQIIAKANLYGIPSVSSENLEELEELIGKYEALLVEADLLGLPQDLSVYDPEKLKQRIQEEQRNKEKLVARKSLNMIDEICTPFELKKFAYSEYIVN